MKRSSFGKILKACWEARGEYGIEHNESGILANSE